MNEPGVVTQVLPGLRPEPLASYLAGLGLLRVLAEQADPAATAAWTTDGMEIATTVADIAGWLVDHYVPAPVVSPWNNGSGFGPKDKEPKRTLDALRAHPSPRLAPLRDAIASAERASARARREGWLTDDGKLGDKARVVQEFRNWCPEAILPWIDACVVLSGDDAIFPPLLGTGGNDGRLDFSTNFHQRLLDVLDATSAGRGRSLASARDLLDGVEAQPLLDAAVGQFDPGRAGGPGSSPFGAAGSRVNPWQYVLLVEGAMVFAATVVRRGEHNVGRAAVPFTVFYASPDGSTSGAAKEDTRGEVWAPVWERPFTLGEVSQLFGEARASWRGKPAKRTVEFYEATRTMGTARGIDRFVRYGLHRRNGLAYAAVPLDQIDTHPDPNVGLLAELEDWPARLRSDQSIAVSGALRQFESAQIAYARVGEPIELANMLAALTSLEQAVGRSARAREATPVRRPRPAQPFIEIFRDLAPEFRVAAGLASCATVGGPDCQPPARTMRQILLPLDPRSAADPGRIAGHWRDSPLLPGLGLRPLQRVLAEVLIWRSRTAAAEPSRGDTRGVLTFRSGLQVPHADLHALASGRLDATRLEFWLRVCLALDWRQVSPLRSTADEAAVPLVAELGLLQPFASGISADRGDGSTLAFGLQPDWAARLAAGQVGAVRDEAAVRLRQLGWTVATSPRIARALNPERGVLIAAALVPRCQRPLKALASLAIRARSDGADSAVAAAASDEESPEHEPDLISAG